MGIGQGYDGVIVANASESHFRTAKALLQDGYPVLVEKPVTLDATEADELVSLGGIAFAGHTRLYSPAWRAFKASVKAETVESWAGGTDRDPWWDWGPHLVAMSFDLGCSPVIHVTREKQPLRVVVNGKHEFRDVQDDPLKVLISEFCTAITQGVPNNAGMRLGARVVHFLEKECPSRT